MIQLDKLLNIINKLFDNPEEYELLIAMKLRLQIIS